MTTCNGNLTGLYLTTSGCAARVMRRADRTREACSEPALVLRGTKSRRVISSIFKVHSYSSFIGNDDLFKYGVLVMASSDLGTAEVLAQL